MKRRHFLQFSSSLFASLGISQFDLMHQANRYAQVLAQGTPRKLALLVGINNYEPALGQLNGCITDVDMHSSNESTPCRGGSKNRFLPECRSHD